MIGMTGIVFFMYALIIYQALGFLLVQGILQHHLRCPLSDNDFCIWQVALGHRRIRFASRHTDGVVVNWRLGSDSQRELRRTSGY